MLFSMFHSSRHSLPPIPGWGDWDKRGGILLTPMSDSYLFFLSLMQTVFCLWLPYNMYISKMAVHHTFTLSLMAFLRTGMRIFTK